MVQVFARGTRERVGPDLPGSQVFRFAGDTFFGRGVAAVLARPEIAAEVRRELKGVLNGCRLILNLEGVAVPAVPRRLAPLQLAMPAALLRDWLDPVLPGVLIVTGSKNLYKPGGLVRLWGAMRTITRFLARKRVASTSAFAVLAKPGSLDAEDRSEPTLADIAARVGGENEELRNLLIETDRRIGALDDLRGVFRNLAEPMGSALQALEQEKADNVTLRNALSELRAAHDSVCSEFSALEKRAAELESAGEELRRELALAQEATRGLERDKTELTSEIVAVRAELANLESQLAQDTAHGRALSEANQILVDHANSTDKRIVELQSEGALMREKLLLLENDKRSLQTALDQTLAETSRLSRRLTESENAFTAARVRLEQMDSRLAAAENERATLATARDEAERAASIRSLCLESAARGSAFACRYCGGIAFPGAPDRRHAHRGDQGLGAQGSGSDHRSQRHGEGYRAAHRRPRCA